MKNILGMMALALMATASALAAGPAWNVDNAHSKVQFSVKHMLISDVEGRFKEFTAGFTGEKDDLTDAVFQASIKTASINTDNDQRDNHLRSDDFLNAEKFPAITFVSTKVEKVGDHALKVTGNLTIRDVTKSVVLDVAVTGPMNDPWGNTRVGIKATTAINRFDYGVRWNKAIEAGGLIAGETVHITLNLEFVRPK